MQRLMAMFSTVLLAFVRGFVRGIGSFLANIDSSHITAGESM
jgi:hypothetical protein